MPFSIRANIHIIVWSQGMYALKRLHLDHLFVTNHTKSRSHAQSKIYGFRYRYDSIHMHVHRTLYTFTQMRAVDGRVRDTCVSYYTAHTSTIFHRKNISSTVYLFSLFKRFALTAAHQAVLWLYFNTGAIQRKQYQTFPLNYRIQWYIFQSKHLNLNENQPTFSCEIALQRLKLIG